MKRRTFVASVFALAAPGAGHAPLRALSGAAFTEGDQEFRLVDILAPAFDARGEAYAREAREALDTLLAGSLRVEDSAPRDRWGRRLARAFDASGAALQERLVDAGAARVRPESADFDFIRRLLERERDARLKRRGLWRFEVYRVRDAADAADAIGGFHLVEGGAARAVKSGGRVFVNFGEDFRTDFTVTAKSGTARRWKSAGLIDLESLAGTRIRVRGYVASINGPSIEVAHPLQVERLDEAG